MTGIILDAWDIAVNKTGMVGLRLREPCSLGIRH